MKLQQLAIGARFEYDGRVYVKTGPLTAASEQGGQALIPRYAVLRPLDLPEPAEGSGRGKPARPAVMAAFNDFYRVCEELAGESGAEAPAEARRCFMAALR